MDLLDRDDQVDAELADAFGDEEFGLSTYLREVPTAPQPLGDDKDPTKPTSDDTPQSVLQRLREAHSAGLVARTPLNPMHPYATLPVLDLPRGTGEDYKNRSAVPSPSQLLQGRASPSKPLAVEEVGKDIDSGPDVSHYPKPVRIIASIEERIHSKQADTHGPGGTPVLKRPFQAVEEAPGLDMPPPPAYRPDLGKGAGMSPLLEKVPEDAKSIAISGGGNRSRRSSSSDDSLLTVEESAAAALPNISIESKLTRPSNEELEDRALHLNEPSLAALPNISVDDNMNDYDEGLKSRLESLSADLKSDAALLPNLSAEDDGVVQDEELLRKRMEGLSVSSPRVEETGEPSASIVEGEDGIDNPAAVDVSVIDDEIHMPSALPISSNRMVISSGAHDAIASRCEAGDDDSTSEIDVARLGHGSDIDKIPPSGEDNTLTNAHDDQADVTTTSTAQNDGELKDVADVKPSLDVKAERSHDIEEEEATAQSEPHSSNDDEEETAPPRPQTPPKDSKRRPTPSDDDDFLVLSEDRVVDPARLAQAIPSSSLPPASTPVQADSSYRDSSSTTTTPTAAIALAVHEQLARDREYARRVVPFASSLHAQKTPSAPLKSEIPPDADPETRARMRLERLEKERTSEEKLHQARRQFEQSSIASSRALDYLKKRKRHQLYARECARRMTYSPQTHQSRIPPAEDEEIASELRDIAFNDGWRSIFAAFRVGQEEDLIKCSRADEEFNSYLRTGRACDADTVMDYLMMVLDGAPPSALVRRVVRIPPEQYDPDEHLRVSSFAMGRCLKAMPYVFNSLMSAQLDVYAERRRGKGVLKEDTQRLLNTAKGHVESFTTLTMQFLAWRYPSLTKMELLVNPTGSTTTTTRRALLVMRECVQEALGEMFFDRGLGLFYYQVFIEEDAKIAQAIQSLAADRDGSHLLVLAKKFGLDNPAVEASFADKQRDIVAFFRDALQAKLCPVTRLSRLVSAFKCLGEAGVSGDDLLPLVIAAVILGSTIPGAPASSLRLYSLLHILDDFGLAVKTGEEGFVLSMTMTAAEVLLNEAVPSIIAPDQ